MSMKNEPLLVRIRQLEEENELLKQQKDILAKNYKIKDYMVGKYSAWKHEVEKVLRKHDMLHLIDEAVEGESYKPYSIYYFLEDNINQTSSVESLNLDTDERSYDKHKARQIAMKAFEEEL